MRNAVWLALAVCLALGPVACREESEAMKKANLGSALSERGAYDKAIATLRDAVALDPQLAMSHELLAQALEAAGRYEEAVLSYAQTVKLDPVRDNAYANMGCLLLSLGGRVAEAETALGQALELNQTHARAHACIGAAYLDQRRFDEAITASSKAISLDPQNIQAHLNLGIAYTETGDGPKARKEIERTIALAGDNSMLVARARMLLDQLDHPVVEGGPNDAPDQTPNHGYDGPV